MTRSKQFSLTTVFGILLIALTLSAAPTTDGEILDLVRVANNAEIAAGELASEKASNPKIREFANTMAKEHRKSNEKGESISEKASLSFKSSVSSTTLKNNVDKKIGELQKIPSNSKTFDRTYIDQQVAMHQTLLNDLKNNLIPNAKSEVVKNYLEETKQHVEHHLQEANKLATSL